MSEEIANKTWRTGFIHLTVDGEGLVSLWDDVIAEEDGKVKAGGKGTPIPSYLKLPLTQTQQEMIEATMKKGGYTP